MFRLSKRETLFALKNILISFVIIITKRNGSNREREIHNGYVNLTIVRKPKTGTTMLLGRPVGMFRVRDGGVTPHTGRGPTRSTDSTTVHVGKVSYGDLLSCINTNSG